MARIIAFGECMIEFRSVDGPLYKSGFAGDVLNTCIYMKRTLDLNGTNNHELLFMTAIGRDAFSQLMIEEWNHEGIDQSLVFTSDDRNLGLYIIRTDDDGERYFTYWRDMSAARHTLKYLKKAGGIAAIPDADIFYFSGISLAILDEDDRQYLIEILRALQARGTQIAFDPNYRPLLWSNTEEASHWMQTCYEMCDIALPGMEDEKMLYADITAEDTIQRLTALGVSEIVVKADKDGMFGVSESGKFHVPFTPADHCIDTTAAGDSFAGTYLAHRIMGATAQKATEKATAVAACVVGHLGAIVPHEAFKKFIETTQ